MAEMNSYYKWCMFFLSVIGLWPYSSKKFRLLQNGIVSLASGLSVICQFLAYFTVERNLIRLLKLTSLISMTLITFTRYHFAWYQIDQMKEFLDQISFDWKINNDEILGIMQTHAFFGKRFVITFAVYFTVVAYVPVCIIVLYHISPIILDRVLPLNESRAVNLPVDVVLMFDREQHPVFTAFLLCLLLTVAESITVGAESFLIMLSWHIAGLFSIASYYFQKAVLQECAASGFPRDCKDNKGASYITSGVIVHWKALQ
nr:PREDICTED: uncharacterized protein LOC105662056 [Megachile rotundata]